MSSAAAATAVPAAEPAPAGKRKLLIILVAVLALIAGGAGGTAWFFKQKAAAADPKDAKAEESKPGKKEAVKPPVFNTLENFTVNLAGGDHFLQLGVVLQLKDEETADKVKNYLPLIRNHILLLLSAKTAEDLQTADGKKKLIEEILTETREPMESDGDHIQAVLLGSMLIQ